MNENIEQDGAATQFKPGQCGNPNGRPRTKPMTDALKALMAEDNNAGIGVLIKKAYSEASKGDFRFFKEIMDRLDGKVIEQIDLTADVNNTFDGLSAEEQALLAKHRGGPGEE